MKRIDERTVEFTPMESRIHAIYWHLRDEQGMTCAEAGREALFQAPGPTITPEFVAYLTEDCLTLTTSGVLIDSTCSQCNGGGASYTRDDEGKPVLLCPACEPSQPAPAPVSTRKPRLRVVKDQTGAVGWRTMIAVILAGLFLGWWLSPARAYGHEPYGGCDEAWQAPKSEGADHCRDHGWVVRARIVVGPKGWVHYYSLPQCAVEDASSGPIPCQWNFANPKKYGKDYWVTGTWEKQRVHYVKGVR